MTWDMPMCFAVIDHAIRTLGYNQFYNPFRSRVLMQNYYFCILFECAHIVRSCRLWNLSYRLLAYRRRLYLRLHCARRLLCVEFHQSEYTVWVISANLGMFQLLRFPTFTLYCLSDQIKTKSCLFHAILFRRLAVKYPHNNMAAWFTCWFQWRRSTQLIYCDYVKLVNVK